MRMSFYVGLCVNMRSDVFFYEAELKYWSELDLQISFILSKGSRDWKNSIG